MSNLYENIDYLCKQNNTNITQMCKSLGIARSALSELASQRTKSLSADNKARIAAFFKVDIEFLDNDFGNIPCPLCGLNYVPNEKGENARHEAKHKKWLEAVKHFGFCWNAVYRENAKARARNMLKYEASPLSENEKVECYETIYKALFSRALEASDYSLDTTSFEDYIAAILFNKRSNVPDEDTDVYNALAKKYGVKKGKVSGTYFDTSIEDDYGTNQIISKGIHCNIFMNEQTGNKLADLTSKEERLLSSYRLLNKEGQKRVDSYIEDLVNGGLYSITETKTIAAVGGAETVTVNKEKLNNAVDNLLKKKNLI